MPASTAIEIQNDLDADISEQDNARTQQAKFTTLHGSDNRPLSHWIDDKRRGQE